MFDPREGRAGVGGGPGLPSVQSGLVEALTAGLEVGVGPLGQGALGAFGWNRSFWGSVSVSLMDALQGMGTGFLMSRNER